MPRVIVTTEHVRVPERASILLDEHVHPVHLSTGHAAAQLVERIAWAISDAEEAERAPRDVARALRRRPAQAVGRRHSSRAARSPRSAPASA